MSKIWVKGHLRAKGGDIAGFEAWAAELLTRIRESDPGTIAFALYPAAQRGDFVVQELYKDSEAALGHLANVGPLLAKMGDVTEPSGEPVEVFGEVSDELRQAYAAWGAVILPLYSEI